MGSGLEYLLWGILRVCGSASEQDGKDERQVTELARLLIRVGLSSRGRCPVGPGPCGRGAPPGAKGGADRPGSPQLRGQVTPWAAPGGGSGDEAGQGRQRSSEVRGWAGGPRDFKEVSLVS